MRVSLVGRADDADAGDAGACDNDELDKLDNGRRDRERECDG